MIKWELRRQFQTGRFRQYLIHGGSRKHRLDDGWMRLAVKPNPEPRLPAEWTPLPQPEYE